MGSHDRFRGSSCTATDRIGCRGPRGKFEEKPSARTGNRVYSGSSNARKTSQNNSGAPGFATLPTNHAASVRALLLRNEQQEGEKETMKYFTPERCIALQDFSSDAVMDAADSAWDEQVEQYEAYYHSIEAALTPEFRRLQEGYYLHDAEVLYLGQHGDWFFMALRLDPPPQQILQLSYELAGQPQIDRNALPPHLCAKNSGLWQYDEVELVDSTGSVCIHSILLSNGWEVRLPFHALRIEEMQALLPEPRNGSLTAGVVHEAETA
jgi:hypothetical protein